VKEDDDGTLVRRCRDGDRGAFAELVARYQKPVYNAAFRLLHDAEDARDIAQTTFLKVFEHLADYDPSYRFYSWIYRIAVNEALSALGRRQPSEPVSGEEPDEAPGPERRVAGEQASHAIEAALARIPPELRTVIVLRHFLQLSYEDMADVLVIPEKTVKSRLYSARQLLRTDLAAHGAP